MFCWCSGSHNFLVKIPNHILFYSSSNCPFKGMLCFLLSSVFQIWKHSSAYFPYFSTVVLFFLTFVPAGFLFACSTSKFFVSKINLTKTSIRPLFLPSLQTLSILQLEIPTLSFILNIPSAIFKVSKSNSWRRSSILNINILFLHSHPQSYVLPPSSSALSPVGSPVL